MQKWKIERGGGAFQGNLRPQLADATIVYLAEREGIDTIFTLDRRDFSVFRVSMNRAINIIP